MKQDGKMKKLFYLSLFTCIASNLLFSIEISHENLWSKYTRYETGCVILGNTLFVNGFSSVEYYSVLPNGDLEYQGILENRGLIKDIEFDADDNMLYVHVSSCISNGPDWINAYQIIAGHPEFCFSTEELPDLWPYKDFVYPTDHYVIFIQPDISPCYNKLTGELEIITYPYMDIVGACNDILIDYDAGSSILNFYQVSDINQPILLFQYNYSIEEPYRTLTRCFDDTHCLLVDRSQVLVFNVEYEQNIFYETTWQFDFIINSEILREPIELENNQIYFGSAFGDNFIYDVSNYNSPIPLTSWFEEDYEANCYCIYESNWLYRTMDLGGIWKYDLNNMPTTQHEEYGYSSPIYSAAYFDGIIYKNDWNQIYLIDPETMQEEVICDTALSIGWLYHKFQNILSIENGGLFDHELMVIDLNSNLVLNHIPLTGNLLIAQNGRYFIQYDNTIKAYELNTASELEYLTEFYGVNTNYASVYDEERIWISYNEGDFLINSSTLEVDHNFADFFSSSSYSLPCKYDNRLIIKDASYNVRLYDISNLDEPVLLDTKTVDNHYSYFILENYVLECFDMLPVRIYYKFENSFTDPVQEYDFDSIIFDIKIDEERNRIITSSIYYFETYTYEPLAIGINIIPERKINLSNYPNPFNPSTTISFSLTTEITEVTEISIYNLKGQKVRTLPVSPSAGHKVSVVWDGTNDTGQTVGSGVYFYQLQVDKKPIASRKCLLLK